METLNFKRINKILKDTETDPLDLLAWFRTILQDHPDIEFPCKKCPYMGQWSFYSSRDILGTDYIIVPGHISPNKNIFTFWDKVRYDHHFAHIVITVFREHYNIKD